MVLYLYDEHHSGHWMDKEDETIEYYNIKNMDIIELKERAVFKIGFIDGSEPNDITCSSETQISYLIKMIICCISSPVDDPSVVGLCCVKKDENLLSERIWLDPESSFGSYHFHQSDELHCMSRYNDSDSSTIARLVIKADLNSSIDHIPRRKLIEFPDIPLLGGEEVLSYENSIQAFGVGQIAKTGSLILTNAHLIFAIKCRGYYDYTTIRIQLGSIARISKSSSQSSSSQSSIFIEIYCKNMRSIRFTFLQANSIAQKQRNQLYDLILKESFPCFYKLFAFYHIKSNDNNNIDDIDDSIKNLNNDDNIKLKNYNNNNNNLYSSSYIFDIEKEYERMGISKNLWRISNINNEYSYCASYPSKLIVPTSINDKNLSNVFSFRSKGRISILTYYHSNTATITRCSQPKVGLTNSRSEADENLTNAIRLSNLTNNNILYLFDCRPKANAIANQAIGMGYEKETCYQNCKFEFLNIDNIHAMRDSYYKLQRLCETTSKDDRNFFTALDNTHWLSVINHLINCAIKIAKIIDREGCSVLLHCSDGWDRTAQLAALAQVFLNPYYRTIKGFQVLIEKDWLSVGHKFGIRCGHADSNYDDTQRSPIFLQFIDCVWQCLNQFPCVFEFNEKYLISIMDNIYSCHYGTFLMNNERERRQANIGEITLSFWSEFSGIQKEQYINPFYLPSDIIYPSTYYGDLKLWKGYYLRYSRTPNPYQGITAELRALQLKTQNESLQEQIIKLKQEIEELKSK